MNKLFVLMIAVGAIVSNPNSIDAQTAKSRAVIRAKRFHITYNQYHQAAVLAVPGIGQADEQ